jgi:tRNA-binding protein
MDQRPPATAVAADPVDVSGSAPDRKPDIDAGAFFAVDMRVGRVVDVEPFPEARKPAWKLTVDFGPAIGTLRTSAQVTNYTAEELKDRLVAGAVNLGRKRIAGFVSEFLVLGAVADDGTVHLLELPDAAEPGSPIA